MKCPQCNCNFNKTNRKLSVRTADKKKFVLRNIKLFAKQDWHILLRKARRELGYSDKTVGVDILYGLKKIYNEVKDAVSSSK